jgi:hypothetical protein
MINDTFKIHPWFFFVSWCLGGKAFGFSPPVLFSACFLFLKIINEALAAFL